MRNLNPSEQDMHEDNHENQADATGREVAPIAAMGPTWKCTYECKNQKHDQNGSKYFLLLLTMSSSSEIKFLCPCNVVLAVRSHSQRDGEVFEQVAASGIK